MRSFGHSAVGLVAAFRVAKPPAGANVRPQLELGVGAGGAMCTALEGYLLQFSNLLIANH